MNTYIFIECVNPSQMGSFRYKQQFSNISFIQKLVWEIEYLLCTFNSKINPLFSNFMVHYK